MKILRVLLADVHRIVLEGLRGLLESEFEIVGAVELGFLLMKHTNRRKASSCANLQRSQTKVFMPIDLSGFQRWAEVPFK